jgi:type I restriction enzyme S subunit
MVISKEASFTEVGYAADKPRLPNGFKLTEAGVIPEDWEIDFIENLAHITTGSRNTQDRVDDGQYPFFVRSQTVERINSYSFDGEAVLTAGDGVGTGKVFHYINGKFDAHQRVYRISDFNERINGHFFYLYFSSHFYLRIMQMTAKSSVDSVRREMIAKMVIPHPPTKAEQEAIAKALSDADALIESLEELVTKKRQIKQGAMQELLTGKKRLAGFEKVPGYKHTEVGMIPEDWNVYTLSEIGKFKNGINKDIQAFGHGSPFVNLMDVFGFSSIATTEQLGLVACSSFEQASYDLRRGDVLLIRSSVKLSGVGLTVVIEKDLPKTVYSGFLIRFRDSGFIQVGYKKYCFNEERFRKSIIGSSSVSANSNINQDSLKRIHVALPPTQAEQKAIAIMLSDMDEEIGTLEEKLTKARQIKQGMMQELLTGKVRLV